MHLVFGWVRSERWHLCWMWRSQMCGMCQRLSEMHSLLSSRLWCLCWPDLPTLLSWKMFALSFECRNLWTVWWQLRSFWGNLCPMHRRKMHQMRSQRRRLHRMRWVLWSFGGTVHFVCSWQLPHVFHWCQCLCSMCKRFFRFSRRIMYPMFRWTLS